jgi:hypothetical protein
MVCNVGKKLTCTTKGIATMTSKLIFYTPLNSSVEKIELEIKNTFE